MVEYSINTPVHLPDLSEKLIDKIDPSEYEDPPKSWYLKMRNATEGDIPLAEKLY